MPTIAEQLTQLVSDRDDLVDNLTTKGISGLTGDETFTELVPEVLNISSGSGGRDWSEIGYSEEPKFIDDGIEYAKQIMQNWDNTQVNLSSKFFDDTNLIFMPLVDTSNCNDFFRFCYLCRRLITFPAIDTSNGTNFNSLFSYCSSLENIPPINTSNGTNFSNAFQGCSALKNFPAIDTSNGTNFQYFLISCLSLETVPQLNFSNATKISNIFTNDEKIKKLGGLINLGQAYLTTQSANYSNYRLDLNDSILLTHDSLMNVINGLYDIATKGCNAQQLVLGSTNLAKLTAEEISTATNKGWSVS